MAIYNEILAGRFARALSKIFSMKGGNPTKQLSGELLAVYSFLSGVENRFPESWDRFGLFVSVTGGPGQFSAVRIRNPANSSTVAVVEKLMVQTTAAAGDREQVDLSAVSLDLGTGVVSERFDPRGRIQSAMILSSSTVLAAAVTPTIGAYRILANTAYDVIRNVDQELPILPGDALTVGSVTAATLAEINIWWRERPLEESERQ